MKKLILFVLFPLIVQAQVTAWRVSGDTTFVKVRGLSTEIPLIVGKKNMDSLFIGVNPRIKDNASFDSTLILKSGVEDNNTGAKIDSFKFSSNYDFLKIYLSGYGSEDTLSFFSSSGDSLEIWVKDMLFKAPKNLPLVTEGTKKYIQLPHEGREFYVDNVNGTNNPDSFSTSGVKDLWYARYLINADSTGTNLISHGQIEDSSLTAADWTFASDYKWSMSDNVMAGYYHPNSTKSLNLTSSNPTTSKSFSMTTYVPFDSGKSYSWEYLLKQTGMLNVAKVSITDSATGFTYYKNLTDSTTFDWTKFGGGLADTISAEFQVIYSAVDRSMDFDSDVGIHWDDIGNHTLSSETEVWHKGGSSGKVVSTGTGDSTSNNVYLSGADIYVDLTADTTYTLIGYFTKDLDVLAIGDSVTMKFAEFDTTFALTGVWTEQRIVFTASAYTVANQNLVVYANKATTFYVDDFSITYNGGDRTAKIVIQGNSIQDAGNMYVDNFIIQELVDTSLGWLRGGDAIIISGDFTNDSLYLDGKYVKGKSYLPITITSKVEGSRILGNWNVKNGIQLSNHIYGIAVSDIYIEKMNHSGLVMTSEDGGLIYGKISRLNIDSTGYWDRTLGIGSPPSVTGAYMGIDIRGQYTWVTNCRVTNTANDILSIYGIHHVIRNVYGTGAYNAGNGDGFQLKQSGYMTVIGNSIYSLRFLKMRTNETIPDTLGGGVYDNKSGILMSQQGGEGSDNNEIAYNDIHGFSNSLAGNVRYTNVHHNYLENPKYNILSGSIGGGTGIATIGWGCNVYDNVIIGAPIGLQLAKDYADSLVVANNSVINFSTYGVQVKKATDTRAKIEWYNNLFYTDSVGTVLATIHNSYLPTVFNYNLYYSPENTFDFRDSTTFASLQTLGYEANGLNVNPLLEYTYRLKHNSPAKDAGTTGLTETDYFDNAAKTNSENIVVNGTFDDSTGWTLIGGGNTIENGTLNLQATDDFLIKQTYSGFQDGDKYSVSFDVSASNNSTILFRYYDGDGVISPGKTIVPFLDGHYEFISEVDSNGNGINGFCFLSDEQVIATIDNFVMKKLIRDTGAHEIQ